uniref:RNA-binding protein KhpB n=1 Tax=uncultured Bacillota bacterium TaxID=344338 RepID=A0A650EP19_9FIRM|nr:hypothetical protein Firmicute1046_2580 [uncultured Firmicutes bacterium]
MLKKIEKSAKNLEEALALAAAEFGVDKSELGYEVLQEVGKGLLGFLIGKEVTISAWLKKDEEAEVVKPPTPKKEESETADKEEAASAGDAVPQSMKNSRLTPPRRNKRPTAPKVTPAEPQPQVDLAVAAEEPSAAPKPVAPKKEHNRREVPDGALEEACGFLCELLGKMGFDAEVEGKVEDNEIKLDVSGARMGLLIGKRGDTLDAVQYLTSLFINREKHGYIKVSIDTENYRAKREETLINLAHGLERRVLREGRSVTLEPMSPNERRIIHSALQDRNRVQTYSIGEEPHRKLVVAPAGTPIPEKTR